MAPFRNDFQRVLRRNHNTSRTGIMAAALLGHPREPVEDRGFRRAVIPGRESVPRSHASLPADHGPSWIRTRDLRIMSPLL